MCMILATIYLYVIFSSNFIRNKEDIQKVCLVTTSILIEFVVM